MTEFIELEIKLARMKVIEAELELTILRNEKAILDKNHK